METKEQRLHRIACIHCKIYDSIVTDAQRRQKEINKRNFREYAKQRLADRKGEN